jgi:hypothetical protein
LGRFRVFANEARVLLVVLSFASDLLCNRG